MHVEREGEGLLLRFQNGSSTLEFQRDDTFPDVGSTIRFTRADDGAVCGFLVSNARLVDLRFVPAELRVGG